MRIEAGYPYVQASGIIRIGLVYDADETHAENNLYLSINEQKYPLKMDLGYLNKHRSAYFGLNSYHCIDSFSGMSELKLFQGEELISSLHLNIYNDPHLWAMLRSEFLKLPALIGLPLRFKEFSELWMQEFPVPNNNTFADKGVIIYEKFISDSLADRAAEQLDIVGKEGYSGYELGSSRRLEHLHLRQGPIAELFHSKEIRHLLFKLYGVEMAPCQSLCFIHGSQQSTHSDFVHLTSYPQNLMCGVWVALEDVRVGAGELIYFPGSHKEPRLTMDDFGVNRIKDGNYDIFASTFDIEWKEISKKYPEERGLIKKGDVLIWDGNLLHAGAPRLNSVLTRCSVVFHFFAKGVACYYDSTGEIGFSGETFFPQ